VELELAGHDLERRVAAAIEAHRPELELLVDEALELELARLVAERLAARNGNGAGVAELVSTAVLTPAPAEPCSRCGQAPRMRERRICRHCKTTVDLERRRRARAREHAPTAAAGDDVGPRPDVDP
jgi:hypothetical protein